MTVAYVLLTVLALLVAVLAAGVAHELAHLEARLDRTQAAMRRLAVRFDRIGDER